VAEFLPPFAEKCRKVAAIPGLEAVDKAVAEDSPGGDLVCRLDATAMKATLERKATTSQAICVHERLGYSPGHNHYLPAILTGSCSPISGRRMVLYQFDAVYISS
jgi:hypothetical protein